MSERKIANLPEKRYSRKPLRFELAAGESAGIRLIKLEKDDATRLSMMERELRGDNLTDTEIINDIKSKNPANPNATEYRFGVVGSDPTDNKEYGRLQGLIDFTIVPIETLDNTMYPSYIQGNPLVLEVSARRSPHAKEGQMASALRQACMRMIGMGFLAQEAQKLEDIVNPHMIIIAFVSRDNKRSMQMLAAVGFERQNRTNEYEYTDRLFILNWRKLYEIQESKRKAAGEGGYFHVSKEDLDKPAI